MKNLLVAVDFSEITNRVVEESATLAKALHAKLWILHVYSKDLHVMAYDTMPLSGYTPEFSALPGDIQMERDIDAEEIKREHGELLNISARLRNEGLNAQALLVKGDPKSAIIDKAADLDCGMVILGSRGHGLLHKALLGSVSESIIRHAPCNVLVVPAGKN